MGTHTLTKVNEENFGIKSPEEIIEAAKKLSAEDIYTLKTGDKNHQNKVNYLRAAFIMLQTNLHMNVVNIENINENHWEILEYAFGMSCMPIYAASCNNMANGDMFSEMDN